MLGAILYATLLLINAMAILNEDRFLARIGWASAQPPNMNAAFRQPYDQTGYGVTQPDVGVKVRLINLIGAVRTLMRIPLIGLNLVVIVYQVLLG